MATTAAAAAAAAAAAQKDETHRLILCYFVDSSTGMRDQEVHQLLNLFAGQGHGTIQPGTWRKAIDYAYDCFNPINAEVNVMFSRLCQLTSNQSDAAASLYHNDGTPVIMSVVPVQDATWTWSTRDEALFRERLAFVVKGIAVKKAWRDRIGMVLTNKIVEIGRVLDRSAQAGFDPLIGLNDLAPDALAALYARHGQPQAQTQAQAQALYPRNVGGDNARPFERSNAPTPSAAGSDEGGNVKREGA